MKSLLQYGTPQASTFSLLCILMFHTVKSGICFKRAYPGRYEKPLVTEAQKAQKTKNM